MQKDTTNKAKGETFAGKVWRKLPYSGTIKDENDNIICEVNPNRSTFAFACDLICRAPELKQQNESLRKDIEVLQEEVKRLLAINEVYANALGNIATWSLPETGDFWDRDKKEPVSYEAAYGSNGAREYIRGIAAKALTHIITDKG